MITLITVSVLGFVCLLLEVLNLRKILVPVTILGLLVALGLTAAEIHTGTPFVTDPYNMIITSVYAQSFSILFIVLAMLIIAISPQFYADKIYKIADYVALKVFILAGAIAMVSFGNLAMFFVGLEVLSIGVYALAASEPKSLKSNEAGMKYFIMGAFASSFILFGIALVYGATGSLSLDAISVAKVSSLPIWYNIGFVMILIGLFFKASIVPFHFWAPDVYEGSPAIVTALMSTLVKVAAIAALCEVFTVLSIVEMPAMVYAIVVLSILTMTVGNITAMRQTNVKRMMAYSGISHAGFMIMALLATDTISSNIVMYYAAAYSLAGVAAFAVIMAVCGNSENENISNFNGLVRRNPILAIIFACALMSLGGIPVFSGFFAKFFTFQAMLEQGHLILVIFGVLNSIVAISYYFGIVNAMFTKENEDKTPLKSSTVYTVVGVIAILINVIIGIFPSLVMV